MASAVFCTLTVPISGSNPDPELKRKFEQVEKEFQEINKLINIGAGVDKVEFAQA